MSMTWRATSARPYGADESLQLRVQNGESIHGNRQGHNTTCGALDKPRTSVVLSGVELTPRAVLAALAAVFHPAAPWVGLAFSPSDFRCTLQFDYFSSRTTTNHHQRCSIQPRPRG